MSINEPIYCSIEHHATLFALFSKHTIETFKENGSGLIYKAVDIYGHERGNRMAERAVENGDSLNFVNSQAYGEWAPQKGEMEMCLISTNPEFINGVTKCPWCAAWKKHDLLEYGRNYCINIDDAVFNGFNSNFHMSATSNLSFGDDHCEFHWQTPLTEKAAKDLANKKKDLGASCTRDFNFHTAHLLYSFSKTIRNELSSDGNLIISKVLDDYVKLFGHEYLDVLESEFGEEYFYAK
ncbi:L-2-amino-thiazoline-4-carboxylic acid hydrolase [Clostridium acidisoli DSM 12555]|uniref:L-2-amino-thiazoline-4-carboxylic acid hydrolase n=1 Tax=Clostridium acidisoli DSM 12555 TaxID=1121291 RepID=A0A1W1XUS5_9CLOT|nr:L-2-amino-thiazoline-4-carboxylic acid hydrolase [Clostridium acidisoli]SMC27615.1 L-2-amino-thiazoline-4-carboxylic acid hydrolase [Clostridium acidisoli DSM 12555]